MLLKEIYENLLRARRPIDFFGSVTSDVDLSKKYRQFAKIVHPDTKADNEKYIANEAFKRLNELYKYAQNEYEKGIYNVFDPLEIYKYSTPLFGFDEYNFYEHVFDGEVANIYKGIDSKGIVYLKVAKDSLDNELLKNEFEVLSKIRHGSLPFVQDKLIINDADGEKFAIIMNEVEGVPMPDFMKEFPKGVPAEHVMWMLERLFSVVGYLHSNLVVHGNIKPEQIIINRKNHKVSLVGFSFCIANANTSDASYKIKNEDFSAPEVDKSMRVLPSSDIYSVGKLAVGLLGGSVKTNGMPITIHPEIRTFVRKLVNEKYKERPCDAWKLWDEVIELRNRLFGTERFKTL